MQEKLQQIKNKTKFVKSAINWNWTILFYRKCSQNTKIIFAYVTGHCASFRTKTLFGTFEGKQGRGEGMGGGLCTPFLCNYRKHHVISNVQKFYIARNVLHLSLFLYRISLNCIKIHMIPAVFHVHDCNMFNYITNKVYLK